MTPEHNELFLKKFKEWQLNRPSDDEALFAIYYECDVKLKEFPLYQAFVDKRLKKVNDEKVNARTYMHRLREALKINLLQSNLYQGKSGCLRLAREFGGGLRDFDRKEAIVIMQESYTSLCVRGYQLKPPVNAKEWIGEIQNQLNKE